MEHIRLVRAALSEPTIMLFAEGTVLKPRSLFSVYNHNRYVPIGNCVEKLGDWQSQGANIVYCTSRRGEEAADIAGLLKKYGFPGTVLYYRSKREDYREILENVRPTVLIEDDCRSNGGTAHMCITDAPFEVQEQIISVVVRECGGIDALPQSLCSLPYCSGTKDVRRAGNTGRLSKNAFIGL